MLSQQLIYVDVYFFNFLLFAYALAVWRIGDDYAVFSFRSEVFHGHLLEVYVLSNSRKVSVDPGCFNSSGIYVKTADVKLAVIVDEPVSSLPLFTDQLFAYELPAFEGERSLKSRCDVPAYEGSFNGYGA